MKRAGLKTLTLLTLFLFVSQSAMAAGDDLLSVNYTVFIQIVIFIAAILILNTLVFKPFINLIDRREKLTKGAIGEAKELEARVRQIIEEYEARLGEARAQAQEERSGIVREAEAAAGGMISKAREETSAILDDVKKKLEAETQSIKQKLGGDVEALAKEISSKILGREAGA